VFSYYNVNKVYTSGFEIDGKWKPLNQLKITGGYQLLFAKDKEAEAAFEKGDVYARKDPVSPAFQLKKEDYFGLFNRSRHMVNLKLYYMLPKWKAFANVRLTYRSKYGLLDSNGNNYLDVYDDFVEAYSILDFSINKTFYTNYSLNIGIDNLFNFTDPQNISNIPGRIIYAKLNINL
jgi:outer membrane receptor for ferrienterochelin and colicins